jgi:hypothetical protein
MEVLGMNLKKLRNLVLSLVGALFLTVFLCGANSVKAASNESPNGHKVYFLASKDVYSRGEEFADVDFGSALSGVNANPRGIRVTAYYTDAVEYYYYIKIDGFEDEVSDVETWLYDYTQPDGSEENYMVNNSYYEVDAGTGKVVAVYYELLLGVGIESGTITFFNGLYIDDSSFEDTGFEQYVFTLRNEAFRLSGTVLQRPDMSNDTKVQYKNPESGATTDYYEDGIFDNLRDIVVVDKSSGKENAGTSGIH